MLRFSSLLKRGLPIQSCGIAVASVGLVWLVKRFLEPFIIHESPFLLFMVAILVSSYYGPRGTGFLATILATIVSDYFFLSPYNSFIISETGQGIQLGLFFLEGISLCLGVAQLKKMQQRAESDRLKILQQREQLRSLNSSLDQRVTDRTEKLTELNQKLSQIIQAQAMTENALRQSEERLQLALEASGDGIWDWNIETGEVYLSPQWLRMLNYSPEELPGHVNTWGSLIHPEDNHWVMQRLNAHLVDHAIPYDFNYRMSAKGGDWKWIANYGKVFDHDAQGKPCRMVGIHRDIHEHKQIELQIAESLQEKEVLLKEVHHRVKNNLQVICSLLNLQARSLHSSEAQEQLKDSLSRIRSMALVHEKLYQSPSLSKISFAGYVEDLTHQLLRTYRLNSSQVSHTLDIDPAIDLTIDIAVPCGLIIQELISNTLKYAFDSSSQEGHIWIQAKVSKDQELNFVYRDNGCGLPSHLDLENLKTLGLQLVKDLVEQLHGSVKIQNTDGAQFNITFCLEDS
jgi:PAS domain S-box-containing protein